MTPPTAASRALVVTLLALAIAGCGADPYAEPEQQPQPPPGEQPSSPLPQQTDRVAREHLAPSPEEVARRAAELTTNWTGETAARRYAELARMSVGAARRDARASAARLPTDPQLADARSTGTVEAIASASPRDDRQRRLIVVTRETVVADGLREARWRVTLATAERRAGGWVLSRWEPQP